MTDCLTGRDVETSVACANEPPEGELPAIPMIPQLLSTGRCPGRVFRNLRSVLGRMPTKHELGLWHWQTVEMDMGPDEMVVTRSGARLTLLRGGQ